MNCAHLLWFLHFGNKKFASDKKLLGGHNRFAISTKTRFFAGMLNVVIANPLWVGATRMRSAQQDQMRQRKEEDQAASDANASEAHEGDAVAAEVDPSSNNNNDNDNDESSSSSSSGGSGGASSSSGPVRAAEYGGVLGLVRLLLAIGKREGVGKLWSGTAAGLVLVSNPAIHFGASLRVYSPIVHDIISPSWAHHGLF